jgi:hypothetical protein
MTTPATRTQRPARAAIVGKRLLEGGHLAERRGRLGDRSGEQSPLERGDLPERLAAPQAERRARPDLAEPLELVAVKAGAPGEVGDRAERSGCLDPLPRLLAQPVQVAEAKSYPVIGGRV